MGHNVKKFFCLLLIIGVFFVVFFVFNNKKIAAAADDRAEVWTDFEKNMKDTRSNAGYSTGTENNKPRIEVIISNIIKVILSFTGAIFLILIMWAGNTWMTAGGNEEHIASAKQTLINSAIGLVIVLAAYLITHLVTTILIGATGV